MNPIDFFNRHSALNLSMFQDQRTLINDLARVYAINGAAASTFVWAHDTLDLTNGEHRDTLAQDLAPFLRERMGFLERAQLAERLYRDVSLVPPGNKVAKDLQEAFLMVIGALLTGTPCWFDEDDGIYDLLVEVLPLDWKIWLFIETHRAEEKGLDSEVPKQ